MNKKIKQAKYNQGHGNKEQTDSHQPEGKRGRMVEMRGIIFKEHVLKDPWTKPKVGRIEGGKCEGGMWTTIIAQQ